MGISGNVHRYTAEFAMGDMQGKAGSGGEDFG
jgi:hypothetical protein